MLAYFTSFILVQQWMHIGRVSNKEVSVCLSGTVLETKLRLHTALSRDLHIHITSLINGGRA